MFAANRKSPMFLYDGYRVLLIVMLGILPTASSVLRAAADDPPSTVWSAPVNLSRSGAASQPHILAAPDGKLQAFWWDRFDGLTTSALTEGGWSKPITAGITIPEIVSFRLVYRFVAEMPALVADAAGTVHAFWVDKEDLESRLRPLLHSRLALGSVAWTTPDVASESASVYEVAAEPAGGLVVAYVRPAHTPAAPAGLYVRRLSRGFTWGPAALVHASTYVRLLKGDEAHLRVTASSDGRLHIAWDDPQLALAQYALSTDGGARWTAVEALGQSEDRPLHPRVAALPNGDALRCWEGTRAGRCFVYQQSLPSAKPPSAAPTLTVTLAAGAAAAGAATPTSTPGASPTATLALTPTWGAAQRVFSDARACPQGDRFWTQSGRLFWLWGEGTEQLTLAAWDAARAQWSEPRTLDLRLRDPDKARWLSLSDLRILPVGDKLVVVGVEAASGDVWLTQGQVSALELASAPSSPWSAPERLATGTGSERPAVTVDISGTVHMAWTQPAQSTSREPDVALLYARWDGARWSRAIEVAHAVAAREVIRHPALIADERGLLHLAWSGGDAGQIVYSRATVAQAASGGWSAPKELSAKSLAGSWPQLGLDAGERLYLVYAVPLNEGRGIYLVASEDGGATWSPPERVFDAEAAGWAMVDHPTLAVAPDGALHVAWVKGALPGTLPPQGISYARSEPRDAAASTGARAWSVPQTLADAGHDWPRLAWSDGRMHLVYIRESDGSVWQRWIEVAAQESADTPWRPSARVSGWQGLAAPVGLASAGGMLHLVGLDQTGGMLRYNIWGGAEARPESARWSAVETLWLGPEAQGGRGVEAAVGPLGGKLAVAAGVLQSRPKLTPTVSSAGAPQRAAEESVTTTELNLLALVRAIPTLDPATRPTWAPTPRPTATPSPTPTPTARPTPTPDLSDPPAPQGFSQLPPFLNDLLAQLSALGARSTQLPPFLGAGLAGAIVLAALGVRWMWVRGR